SLLTSAELDVGLCSASSMTRLPDVDRTPIAREAAEDRGVIRRRRDGRRTVGGGGGAGTGSGASHRTRSEGSGDRDAVFAARPMVAPSVSRSMPALRLESLSSLSATAQHRHGPGAEGLHRSGSMARVW